MLVVNLSAQFVQAGHESTVLALSDAEHVGNSADMEARMASDIAFAGGHFHSLGLRNRRNILSGMVQMRRFLRSQQPDVVHTHTVQALPALALAGFKGPVICTHHNSKLSFPAWAFRFFDRIVHSYVAISAETEAIYHAQSARPVARIPNAAAPTFAVGEPREAVGARPVILSVGAISTQKNYGLLIETARQLKQLWSGPTTPEFWIAGGGTGLEGLRAMVKEHGLDDCVQFLGERSDVKDLMRSADLYLNTSLYEGMPISFLEAMASALPIVATEVAGNRELITNEENGFLVTLGDPRGLADSIARILTDAALYRRMSAGSQLRSGEFTIEATADRHLSLYASAKR